MTDESDIVAAARAAMAKAYAPYSRFKVGAALRGESGRLYAGCNVENAAYPQGWCAEASAIAAMVMAGETRIVEAAVMGGGEAPCTPCGGCRQPRWTGLSGFRSPGWMPPPVKADPIRRPWPSTGCSAWRRRPRWPADPAVIRAACRSRTC